MRDVLVHDVLVHYVLVHDPPKCNRDTFHPWKPHPRAHFKVDTFQMILVVEAFASHTYLVYMLESAVTAYLEHENRDCTHLKVVRSGGMVRGLWWALGDVCRVVYDVCCVVLDMWFVMDEAVLCRKWTRECKYNDLKELQRGTYTRWLGELVTTHG